MIVGCGALVVVIIGGKLAIRGTRLGAMSFRPSLISYEEAKD